MDSSAIERAARGLLDRYLVEIVERFDLCPWARPARERGELHVEILVAPGAHRGRNRRRDSRASSTIRARRWAWWCSPRRR